MDLHHNLTDFDKFHIFSLCYTNVHHDCATHHGSNDGPTGHPGIFFEQKENFNLPIACAFPLCIGNSEAVSPRHSFVHL